MELVIVYPNWLLAIKNVSFRRKLIIGIVLLFLATTLLPHFFKFIEARPGYSINDTLLNVLPAADVSAPIFLCVWCVTDTGFSERANVPEKGLKAAAKTSMKPEQVARMAIDSMLRKRTETITELITKATTFIVKVLSKKFSEKMAAKFYQ